MVRISVVTINLNNRGGLHQTIESVISQTDFDRVEYIIVDGVSSDGSQELIKSYESHLAQWTSERDEGIYDAMNKGASRSTGDYVIYLNSGDLFANTDVVKVVGEYLDKKGDEIDLIYGEAYKLKEDGSLEAWGTRAATEVWRTGTIWHNSLFTRTQLMQENPFKISKKLKLTADFDFIYRMYLQKRSFVKLDFPIVHFEVEGLSTQRSKFRQNVLDVLEVHWSYLSWGNFLDFPWQYHLANIGEFSWKPFRRGFRRTRRHFFRFLSKIKKRVLAVAGKN